MTLDEISVTFSADAAPFADAVSTVCELLFTAGNAADALADRFHSSGVQAGEGLANGLSSMRGAVAAAARTLADAASDALRGALDIHSPSRLTYEIGLLFDEGLTRGLVSGAEAPAEAARRLGGDTAASLESTLSAPGRSAARAEKALSALSVPASLPDLSPAYTATPSLSAADAAPISLTIPLEIDGYRLGVAAIEGINRVARGAGRVSLEI